VVGITAASLWRRARVVDIEKMLSPGMTTEEAEKRAAKKLLTKGEPWDIADTGVLSNVYLDPYDFLNLLFDSRAPTAGAGWNEENENVTHFDDPSYNRRLEAADTLTGPARYRAAPMHSSTPT
jgi:ABC-type oligopeptide transport system substrate-binding subunit